MPAKFTNKHNIPEHIVQAIIVDDHFTNGDISVTGLIDAPQVFQLKKTNTYEMDAMDLIPAFMGTGLHTALERSEKGRYKARILKQAAGVLMELGEEKASAYMKKILLKEFPEMNNDHIVREANWTAEFLGWVVSGTLDIYNEETKYIEDYKMTSASAFMYPEFKSSWNAQMNCYACILRLNGKEVLGARIHAFFKDWSRMKVLQNRDYPKHQYMTIEINMIDQGKMVAYMEKRVELHQKAASGVQIDCTGKDRWASSTVYAVMKKGGKKSLGNHAEKHFAQAKIDQIEHKYPPGVLFVEERPGTSRRCEDYCPVKGVCPQYQKELKSLPLQAQEIEE